MTPLHCLGCESRLYGLCSVLPPDQLLFLSRHINIKMLPAGTELLRENIDAERYSTLVAGVVKLTKLLPDGRQQIVGLQFAPDLVGWPVGPQSFINAKSATDIKICSVSKYCMDRLISKNPAIMSKILERTLGDLDEARDWMLTLGRKNAEEKVASFLLLIAKRTQPSHARKHLKIGLPISRTEIADFLGLTIETVSRKLATLQSQGVLKLLARHHVVVPCLVSLMERAGAAESKISHRASQH